MSVRTERVASVIKTEIGNFLQRHLRFEDVGLMTVTEVRMTPDLRQAKIYVSVLGEKERKETSMALLEEQKPVIRTAVGQAVRLRFTPELSFILDETMDNAMNLERLFKRIHEEEKNRPKNNETEEDA